MFEAAIGTDIYVCQDGGITGGDEKIDLWVFSTTKLEWTLRISGVEGPSPRSGHAMAAVGADIFLFGGGIGFNSWSDELWVFSTMGEKWTRITVVGQRPSGQQNHAMTALGTNVYLFGGNTHIGESRGSVRCGGWLYVCSG